MNTKRTATSLPPEGLISLLELSSDAAGLVDPADWQLVYANPQLVGLADLFSTSPARTTLFDFFPELDNPTTRSELSALVTGERSEARIDVSDASSGTRHSAREAHVRRVESADRVLLAMVVRTAAAGVDPLTGLLDRSFILRRLTEITSGERKADRRAAVLFVDVDGFKQVNDAYGHLVGDGVLREVARRLASSVRAGDLVARFGGDEFVVLLDRVDNRTEIEPAVRRIEGAILQPFAVAQGEVMLSVSIGAAQVGVDGTSAEELIGAADRAMYASKRTPA